jgi:hypothetical protein
MEVLSEEFVTYRAHRERLLRSHSGGYVVITGTIVLGVFDSLDQAFVAGVEHCGPRRPFLLQLVCAEEPEQELPALVHGLIDARLP